jgi:site-specific DNA-methyltransferase (adenine-specific)
MEQVVAIAPPGGLVLDPFLGSGTTGVAALRTGRSIIGAELSDYYVNLARERMDAELANTTVKASRAGQSSLFGGAP